MPNPDKPAYGSLGLRLGENQTGNQVIVNFFCNFESRTTDITDSLNM